MISTADVVIIGGGISGVSIAYNLAVRGVKRVVVIEKGYLCSGSTGRCGAGIRMQWGTEMNCAFAQYSINFYEHANEALEYDGDIGFKQGGYLIVASTEKEEAQFKKNLALQHRLGIPSVFLTPQEAKAYIPYLDETKITCATFCPKDGHLNPFHTTQAYADAATRLGVTILKHVEVVGIETRSGKITAVRTNQGVISTNVVVNAAGSYAKRIAAMVGVDIPLTPDRHQILVTEPVDPIQDPMLMSFSMNIYCQQTPEGSFIMGRSGENEPSDFNIKSSWDFLEKMAQTACTLLPPLRQLNVVRQWSGLYELTPDRQPLYGRTPEVEGFFLACGFSGHGFMFGPATGAVIAHAILGLDAILPIHMLDVNRFARGEEVWEPSVV